MPGLIERPSSFGEAIALDPYWADGLVGAWFMNEGKGSPIVYDASGNGNDGVLTNMDPATAWGLGEDGWALDFDKVSQNYVALPGTSSGILDFPVWGPFTIGAIVYLSSVPSVSAPIVTKGDNQWSLKLNDGEWILLTVDGQWHRVNSGASIGWHYIVGVVYKTSSMALYIDGVLVDDTIMDTGGASRNTTFDVHIAHNAQASSRYASCRIACIHAHNRALSAAEIRTLYETRGNCLLAKPDYGWLYGAQVPGFQELAGALSGNGDLAGVMLVDKALAGELSANGDLAGSMLVDKVLAGVLSGDGDLAGIMLVDRALAGALSGDGNITGSMLVDRTLAGALSGDGDLAGSLLVDRALSGMLSGDGNLAGSMLVDKVLAGELSGNGDLAGVMLVDKALVAALSGDGDLAGIMVDAVGLPLLRAIDVLDIRGGIDILGISRSADTLDVRRKITVVRP